MGKPKGNPKKRKVSKSAFKSLIAGGICGAIDICITMPTELIKTKMQLYPEWSKAGVGATVKDTLARQGYKGLYIGLSTLLFFSVPKTGVRFSAKKYADEKFFKGRKSRINTVLAGLFAGVTEAITVVTPQETLKTKLMHDKFRPKDKQKYDNLIHGCKKILAKEGLKGVYKGCLPTIMRQGSNQAIRFLVYGEIMRILKDVSVLPYTLKLMMGGGIAGTVSVLCNNPIDNVKTNMQGLNAGKYKSSLQCFTGILKEQGVRGLYKGTIARLSRVVTTQIIIFTLYEHIQNLFITVWPDKH